MDLSNRQRQTINVALTILASGVIIGAVLGLFWILTNFVQTFSHVILPFLVAGIGAMVFQPYYDWLRKHMPMYLAVIALFASVLIPIGIFVGFFGVIVGRQVVVLVEDLGETIKQAPTWYHDIEKYWPDVKEFFTTNPMGEKISQTLQELGPRLVAALQSALEYLVTGSIAAGSSAASWSGALLSWAVAPVYFVFFLIMEHKDVRRLEDQLPFLKSETRTNLVFLVDEFINIIVAFFRGQIIIAFLQGVLLAIGFSLVGLKFGLLLGFLLGFLNVIPYLGSMVGLAITLPLAFFQQGGGAYTLAGVIVVLLAVQTIEGYYLTPKIMGERTGLHPMAIIFAVFFWGAALGGILGMILAIPLTAFIVVFWRLVKDKYISELV